MKQTAVEWLLKRLQESGIPLLKDELEFIEQAKEIEKHYIKDAFIIGINNGVHGYKTSEEYYEKTYKK
jgi:HEPN domain-containing protein